MSQQDALKILKKKRVWMTSKEISQKIKIGHNTTACNLSKLYQQGEVSKRKKKRREMEFRISL